MNDIKITSQGIEKTIKKYNMLDSICEYIWNGFDAQATLIFIKIDVDNVFQKILKIEIEDNGTGINYETLQNTFSPFLSSEKPNMEELSKSTYHGKNGIGRLTYSNFAEKIRWITTYCKNNELYKYEIHSTKSTLDKYGCSTPEKDNKAKQGTKVIIENIYCEEYIDNLKTRLINEFSWFIILNPIVSIYINEEKLDILPLIEKQFKYEFNKYCGFEVTIILWKKKINEYSKFYYIDSAGNEAFNENTTFNNKGDNFYHSVYIRSSLFDNFSFDCENQLNLFFSTKQSEEYKYIYKEVVDQLKNIRVSYLKNKAPMVVKELKVEKAFKNFNKNNPIDVSKKECLTQMLESIYVAQPKVLANLNEVQSKTLIRLLDLALDSGEVDSIFKILDEIVELMPEERKELSKLLELTSLSNIIKTTGMIKDRLKAIEDFKQIIFNEELNANEVLHVQKMMEENYWLLGEQYYLFSKSEDTVLRALKNYANILQKEYDEIKEPDIKDKYKQFDLLLSRTSVGNEYIENVLVELKHPKIKLSSKQFEQVQNYMNIIKKQDLFNDKNVKWRFYLIGNSYNETISNLIDSAKNHGENSLVLFLEDGRYKVYVKTWSQIFNEFEIKYCNLLNTLSIEKSKLLEKYKNANEILERRGLQ